MSSFLCPFGLIHRLISLGDELFGLAILLGPCLGDADANPDVIVVGEFTEQPVTCASLALQLGRMTQNSSPP